MKRLHLLLLLLAIAFETTAQNGKKISFNARAGFSVGAVTPVRMPESIRKIESYDPGLLPSLEVGLDYRFTEKLGVATALRFEQKGMTTDARVKAYYTTFNEAGSEGNQSVTGYFTGRVTTKIKNSYLTLPLHLTYHPDNDFSFKAGGFLSVLLDARFSGHARDGYIRHETPIGERENIDAASYDFAYNVRRFNAGVEIGADYHFSRHVFASANLNYALSPLMDPEFHSIAFGMHNIYLNLGIGYRFH
ncbi:MAG: PorT family protein [Dyadobacter sp.]|uniref:porin family protein n=1 Tax=Dyadobacter sp. TaxID=1914288 RepID=UPI001AFD9E38|nr:porin family protein [Dyadobacter sp.]MBO9617058.1 PorT family protein [Dyadobacter sp.]